MAEKAQTEQKLTLEKFEQAYEIVKKVTKPTGLIESEFFSQSCGNKVYLKPENMQVTGAYKIRGAYYKISTLTEEARCPMQTARRDLSQRLLETMHRVLRMQQRHMV